MIPVLESGSRQHHVDDNAENVADSAKDALTGSLSDETADSVSAHDDGSGEYLDDTAVQTISLTESPQGDVLNTREVVQASLQNTYRKAFKRLNFFGHLATGAKQLIQTHMHVTCNLKLPIDYPDLMRSMQCSAGALQSAIRKAPRAQRRKVLLIPTNRPAPSDGSVTSNDGSEGGETAALISETKESALAPAAST